MPSERNVPLVEDQSGDSTPEFSNRLMNSYQATKGGMIIETGNYPEPHFFTQVSEFELWLGDLEKHIGLPLGRKLAHSAAESEEFRLQKKKSQMPNSLFNKMKKRLDWINLSWELRGLGVLELMNKDKDCTKMIVHKRAHSAFAAGMASSTYEILSNSRYRFHWTDDGNSESLVTLELDPRKIPQAEKIDPSWIDAELKHSIIQDSHPLSLAYHETPGTWSIDGFRMMGISQDLLIRFEESIMPQLIDDKSIQDEKFVWKNITDSERKKTWNGFADASRKRFIASEEMVLVAEAEHWKNLGNRFLSRFGLGSIDFAESIDSHGGVKINLSLLFHPALVAGILTAAWERAEARPAKCEWSCHENGHMIQICSLHELA